MEAKDVVKTTLRRPVSYMMDKWKKKTVKTTTYDGKGALLESW
jgi:hypothetical protein